MTTLCLTARVEGRNDRHARIGVFQNGGKAGRLFIESEHEQAVCGLLNAAIELLAVCKKLTNVVEVIGHCTGEWTAEHRALAQEYACEAREIIYKADPLAGIAEAQGEDG